MPKYHFSLENGGHHPDEDGVELDDVAAARIEAARLCGQMLRDEAETFWEGKEWILTVTNDQSLMLFRIYIVATDAPTVHG